ncbi:MAG: LysM peptidoglycan-binding domain-containing protein [Chlamydiae bacterium]|nr:LysM peptidoglycan-binding domain-containing protein [Chlamydiota bacterium]
MHSPSFVDHWRKKAKSLTQFLIISITLNIGFIATLIYFSFKETVGSSSLELKPQEIFTDREMTTLQQVFNMYSSLSFQELLLRLANKEHIEEGYTKRDIALSCLVAFHYFNLERALGGMMIQKRSLLFTHPQGEEQIEIALFPALTDCQYSAVVQYAKIEKWPLTTEGLFYKVQSQDRQNEEGLFEAFFLTPEFHFAQTLFNRSGSSLKKETLLHLIAEGTWLTLTYQVEELKNNPDFSPEKRRQFLLRYLSENSKIAANLLLEQEYEFTCKKLDDAQILHLISLLEPDLPPRFAQDLLASPRSDVVLKKIAASFGNLQKTSEIKVPTKSIIHTVESGDSLWKIAKKYKVPIQLIIDYNHLESERIRPGKKLEIPRLQEVFKNPS